MSLLTLSRRRVISHMLLSFCLALFAVFALPAVAADTDNQQSDTEEYFTARMGGSLWDTLIDNGVDPTQWRYVFQFNREHNPAFARITSANRIPRGVTIYIPLETDKENPIQRRQPRRPRSSTITDTVSFYGGNQYLKIKTGRGQSISSVVRQFCIPDGIDDKRLHDNMVRTIAGDIRDIYRRAGEKYSSRASQFHIPVYLAEDRYDSLTARIARFNQSPHGFIDRGKVYEVDDSDIRHVAVPGETYVDLADRYVAPASEWPESYAFHGDQQTHTAYMAQQIRHYNMNQQLWGGKVYYIPSYLLNYRYKLSNKEVKLKKATSKKLVYDNGLEISLSHHVTRRKTYYRRRLRYLPPLDRRLGDNRPAYPDMIVWHRTGIEPEVEKALREKKRTQFSLNYIYRMAVTNYYIDELGNCFLIVDPDKNPRDHSGNPVDYRCFWNGQNRVSDISIGIEIEAGFTSVITSKQLETARKLQHMLRSMYIIPDERVLDHRKVASRRGPDNLLYRGRKADGLTGGERLAIGIEPVLDPDVLRGLVHPNLNDITSRQTDSTDFWFNVDLDPDMVASARKAGWRHDGRAWLMAEPNQDLPARPIQSSFD